MGFKEGKVCIGARSGKAGEDMVNAKKQVLLAQIGDERHQVVAPALQLPMVPFRNIVYAHMQLGAAGGVAGDFLAEKEVGVAPQAFDGIHGIMIGHGHQIHTPALENAVNSLRLVIALPADPVHQRDRAHAGVQGVDVQIAPHIYVLAGRLLQIDDGRKNAMLKH
jgi:hypothetical protein